VIVRFVYIDEIVEHHFFDFLIILNSEAQN